MDGIDQATRTDYQSALDAYDLAKRAVPELTSHDEVRTVVDVLPNGHYALACVQARLEGRPIPEFRTPCFFNPQQGPSVEDVRFTDARRGTRVVPACAQDAARARQWRVARDPRGPFGSNLQPSWNAGAAYLPYGKNYYTSAMLQVGYRHTADGSDSGLGGSR